MAVFTRNTAIEYAEKLRSLGEGLKPADRLDPEASRRLGIALRRELPYSLQGAWVPSEDRPDPVALIREQGATRVPELLPLRYERMGISAFTFYRGAALIMASDLSTTPNTGINVQACGDAHISNFGLFDSAERRTVFDINDFDETSIGPWEWDLKRLMASVEICGRDRGFSEQERRKLTKTCTKTYRKTMVSFAEKSHMDVWYAHLDMDDFYAQLGIEAQKTAKVLSKTLTKAKGKDSTRAISKLTEVVDGRLRIVSDPPIVVPLRDIAAENDMVPAELIDQLSMAKVVERILAEYRLTLDPARRNLINQYAGVDVARKVVGVGSVGTRAWIIVLEGANENDHLVLQVKEAQESVLERFCGKAPYNEHGRRVVEGIRAIQATSDQLLGWCRLPGKEGKFYDYYVRQLWDGKGSFDLNTLGYEPLLKLVEACAWTLARAHARTGDRFAIASYLEGGKEFDDAMIAFANAYAEQNELDYARFLEAVAAKEL